MWNEAQRADLARIDENDRMAAAAAARRHLDGRARTMLETSTGNGDNSWEWQASAGLGVWLFRRRRVAHGAVLEQLGRVMTGLEGEARGASTDRMVAPDEWALRLAGIATASALVAGAFAAGGWARLDVVRADVEAHLLAELGYLDAFADDLAAGNIPRDGRFVRRAVLYGAAGWGLYMALRGREARRRGYFEERNVLDPGAEHCGGCEDETGRGWVAIGSLTPVGGRQCLSHCRCYVEYRNERGEVGA